MAKKTCEKPTFRTCEIMLNPCRNPNCRISTGICGCVTFGRGKLDNNGYFEHGCSICAGVWKRRHPEDDVWPAFEDKLCEYYWKEKEPYHVYNGQLMETGIAGGGRDVLPEEACELLNKLTAQVEELKG